MISKWYPEGEFGAILITSRYHIFSTSSFTNGGVELSKLDEDAAIDMILAQVPDYTLRGDFDEKEEARQIAQRVAYLPLGIQFSICSINADSCTLQTYNSSFSDIEDYLRHIPEDEKILGLGTAYPENLVVVFKKLLSKLEEDAVTLMEAFALLDPDNIQDSLLETGLLENPRRSSRLLLNGITARNTDEGDSRLTSVHVHRITQGVVKMQMGPSSRQEAFELVARMLSSVLPDKPDDNSIPMLYQEYFPHTQSLHRFYTVYVAGDKASRLLITVDFISTLRKASWFVMPQANKSYNVYSIPADFSRLCYRRGYFDHGLSFLSLAEDILVSHPRDSNETRASEINISEMVDIHYNHACIATEIGDFDLSLKEFNLAKEFHDKLKAQGYPDPKPTRASIVLGGIANSQNGLGNDSEADITYRKCLALGTPDDIHSAYEVNICRSWWARGLSELKNDSRLQAEELFKKAEARLRKLIDLREAAYGKDDVKDYM